MATPVMIYDDACPMCKGYTKAFDRLGWSGRRKFSELPKEVMERLDIDRARHEIPLLDEATGEVHYGLDSQITVLTRGLPIFAPILRSPALKWMLKPLYNLITYNRRVIAGTRPPATGFDCAPDFHLGWRLTYLAMATVAILLLNTLGVTIAGLLGVALVTGLLFTHHYLSFLGNVVTIALALSIAALVLPPTGVAILFGVEMYRRFH